MKDDGQSDFSDPREEELTKSILEARLSEIDFSKLLPSVVVQDDEYSDDEQLVVPENGKESKSSEEEAPEVKKENSRDEFQALKFILESAWGRVRQNESILDFPVKNQNGSISDVPVKKKKGIFSFLLSPWKN